MESDNVATSIIEINSPDGREQPMSEFLGVMPGTEDIESGTHCNTRVYFACHPYIKFKIQSPTRTFFEPERIKNQVTLHSFQGEKHNKSMIILQNHKCIPVSFSVADIIAS